MVAMLAAGLLATVVVPGASAAGPAADSSVVDVAGVPFTPVTTATPHRLTARERENIRVLATKRPTRPTDVASAEHVVAGRPTAPHVSAGTGAARQSASSAAVSEGASAMSYGSSGSGGQTVGLQGSLALVGSRVVVASNQQLEFRTSGGLAQLDYTGGLSGFFNLPGGEYWWGASVAASIKQGRFVVVLPSFQGRSLHCGKSFLNVAVSKTSNPQGAWTRYRIATTDAYTDAVRIGMSDTKVVFSTNEWDLRPTAPTCVEGGAWEGARLKVVDWADLINGGTLAVKDVSPTPRTNYFSWVPAVNTPTATSTSGGATIRLVGERRATTWGDVAYATITGGVKAGTAKLVGNADLTAKRGLEQLSAPPANIAAYGGGDGGLTEAITSVAARGSRLYFTGHVVCKLHDDTEFRACARIVELNVSTALPTVTQDVWFVEMEQDTFAPQVGVARDGTVFVTMARSSATSPGPVDHFVAYRGAGETFDVLEVLYEHGTAQPLAPTYASGSIVPDQANPHRVIALYDQQSDYGPLLKLTAFLGNLTADPTGTFVAGGGTGWWSNTNVQAILHPDPASPVMWVRWSGSPDTTDTPGGPMLTNGQEDASMPWIWPNWADPAIGGTGTDPFTMYVQWRTGEGLWSPVVSTEINLDSVPPVPSIPERFLTTGMIGFGHMVPVRMQWAPPTDDESGVGSIRINRYDHGGDDDLQVAVLGPGATGVNVQVPAMDSVTLETLVSDNAGNGASAQAPAFTVRETEDTSTAITYSSGWTKVSSHKANNASVHAATKAGARATYMFTGRSIALVVTKGPTLGKAQVWVDGVLSSTIDLYRSSTAVRQVVWAAHWDASAAHTIVVKVLGTPGRPRIELDEFLRF